MGELPPGQHAVEGFPRFGTHLNAPPPPVPAEPKLEIGGAVTEPLTLPLSALATLPRREQTSDFHCVAGWTAVGLRWEGVPFAAFYRDVLEPALRPGATVSHVVFVGLDGYWSVCTLEDAMADDVLLAEHLDGRPLEGDHGAPLRLVTPGQYGFVNLKHLCRIEVHTSEPKGNFGSASLISTLAFQTPLFRRHPRARVWSEERHPYIPGRMLRGVYRALTPPIEFLSARGSRRDPPTRP